MHFVVHSFFKLRPHSLSHYHYISRTIKQHDFENHYYNFHPLYPRKRLPEAGACEQCEYIGIRVWDRICLCFFLCFCVLLFSSGKQTQPQYIATPSGTWRYREITIFLRSQYVYKLMNKYFAKQLLYISVYWQVEVHFSVADGCGWCVM